MLCKEKRLYAAMLKRGICLPHGRLVNAMLLRYWYGCPVALPGLRVNVLLPANISVDIVDFNQVPVYGSLAPLHVARKERSSKHGQYLPVFLGSIKV